MSEELNLSVPQRKSKAAGNSSKGLLILLVLVLGVGVANIVLTLKKDDAATATTSGLTPDSQKDLALKLEKQGLHESAIRAWQDFLVQSGAGADEQAKIWYRIGKLYQQDEKFEQALESFYRSESYAKLDDISDEIGRRTQECLEAAGKFAALRYELKDRVDQSQDQGTAGQDIVAEIGAEKITQSQLDQMIEQEIDRQLTQMAGILPAEQMNQQKEQLLKRFAAPQEKLQMLNQFIMEDVLYRRARQVKLTEKPQTRDLLKNLEKKVLAQSLVQSEMADKINITPVDLNTYYQAHLKDYLQPEQAQISHILVADQETADTVLKTLKGGGDFTQAAKEFSQDVATRDNGGKISGWVQKGSFIPEIGYSDEVTGLIFSTDPNTLAPEPVQTDKGRHIIKVRARRPERQKAFEEVQMEVFRTLRQQKEREVQEALIEELKDGYNVVIHHSMFMPKEEKNDEPAKP